MRIVKQIVWMATVFFLFSLGTGVAEEAEKTVAAHVNGKPIFEKDLTLYLSKQVENAQSKGKRISPDMLKSLRGKLLDQLIERELLYQVSVTEKMVVEDKEVESNFNRAKNQDTSIAPEKLKELIRANMMIDKVIRDQVINKIKVSEKDLKEYYEKNKDKIRTSEQVRARHILVKIATGASEKDVAEAKKKIAVILAEVKAGKKEFADLAKEHSQGPSASRGGDLGFFGKGRMVPSFEKAAFALNPGAVSDVVKTQFGFHIIKVEEKRDAKSISFVDAKERIRQHLMRGQVQGKIQAWVSELKSSAKIVLADNGSKK